MFQCLASRPDWGYSKRDLRDCYPELRSQLNEQLRALDGRVDTQTALVLELQDWVRRRAELHQDYAAKLDKLNKTFQARHKEHKVKREAWSHFSVYNCWQMLINQTRRDARDHAAMADVYINNIIPRFTQVQDDVQRIYKKCREIGYESHEELLKVLHELHTTMRTYHTYQAEFKSAEVKLQNFKAQKSKLEADIPKEKLEKRKKFKVLEKEIQKRSSKYMDAKLKAQKARNEYILSMESANSSIHKYFVEDLSDIVDCMDFGFHSSIARALLTHISGQECFKRTLQTGIDELQKSINNLDSRLDKQRFLESNNAAFMLPKKFEFQGHKGDEINHVMVTRQVQEELEKRYEHLVSRLTGLKTESEETWKTIETAEKTLMEMINLRDYDVAHYFIDDVRPESKQPEAMVLKLRADRQETEEFYLSKFRDYTLGGNLITRLQARYEALSRALGNENHTASSPAPTRSVANKPRRRRIGRGPMMGQPKLFGGSLEEYLEATGQEIPLIMKSCIRVINLYGLHHQGIFRVSGSQVEINNFREYFERMEDPLADVSDASDINSVAGVLKLYLRELREPLFPTVYFDQFMEIAQLESKQEFVNKMREVVTALPRSVIIVLRYLFAFLNHLSEFSDENMMDPYNLAICFGPTLVPIPEDKDQSLLQVQYQNLVNELIKNIIIFSEDIFINDGGQTYEKYISRDSIDLEADVGDAPSENLDDVDSEQGISEDDLVFKDKDFPVDIFGKGEILEAVAQFDFTARTERELNFHKGDILVLHSQVSSDWWKGAFQGKQGLIPDKYILLKIRDEDKEKLSDRSSSEDFKRRASSSSESILTASDTPSRVSHNGGAHSPVNPGTNLHVQSPVNPGTNLHVQDASFSPIPQSRTQGRMSPACSSSSGSSINKLDSSSPIPFNSSVLYDNNSDVSTLQEEGSYNDYLRSKSPLPYIDSGHTPASVKIQSWKDSDHGVRPPIGGVAVMLASNNVLTSTPDPKNRRLDLVRMSAMSEQSTDSLSSVSDPISRGMSSDSSTRSSDPITRGISSDSLTRQPGDSKDDPLVEQNISWDAERRPPSQSSLSSSSSEERLNTTSPRVFWERRSKVKTVTGAPDLVMDLPVNLSSSPKETGVLHPSTAGSSESFDSSSSGRSTPGDQSPDMTAAECFAKQNQSTLKKTPTIKTLLSTQSTDAQTQTHVPMKIGHLEISPRSRSTELKICEDDEITDVQPQNLEEKLDSSERLEPQVEIRSAADLAIPSEDTPTISPLTPRVTAKYLQAVAAAQGSTPPVKPTVRVKPTVLKKPSLPRASPEPEPST